MSLTIPFITWGSVVALMALILIAHVLRAARKKHVFELGSEREELFVPGDPLPKNAEDYGEDAD